MLLPHPRTRDLFDSPVAAGGGWPGEPADPTTPVARSTEEVSALAAGATALADLDACSTVCRACPRLVAWREEVAVTRRRAYRDQPYWGRPAAGFGDPGAGLLIVGLAPAAHGANRTGRLFTGDRSGDWLFAALHRVGAASQAQSTDAADGLVLSGVRMVAAVRCAPPGNKPSTVERDTCLPWLRREVELTSPTVRVMMALGAFGWQATLGVARSLGWQVPVPAPRFGHGARAELTRGDGVVVHLVGCYHVSQQNTQTGRLTEAMLDHVLRECRVLADG
ncbi:uracil-DNA glycosylase [Actinotalea sp. K2]|uniref:uracil-DNA glycosylase n=1 Tax=Actinotalea sp. K2 TaxID=2939438 RepID=UPI00201780BC|nr:uracil-DNA glycosylase [Actinotalea sp. K2]MCL3861312.1 uracil-DNA glycosylase [Actinotalea sp. K2]